MGKKSIFKEILADSIMEKLNIKEVNQYISGNHMNAPKCKVCHERVCYIIVGTDDDSSDNKCYTYSKTCNQCTLNREYITDMSANAYVDSKYQNAPLCVTCGVKRCFIRVEGARMYYTKKCSFCIGSKFF